MYMDSDIMAVSPLQDSRLQNRKEREKKKKIDLILWKETQKKNTQRRWIGRAGPIKKNTKEETQQRKRKDWVRVEKEKEKEHKKNNR